MSVIDKSLGEDKPIFCSSCGYTPHECDSCRERLLEDKPPNDCVGRPGENPGSDTIYFRDPYETQDAVPPPNHFDPYEALDRVECSVKHHPEPLWFSSHIIKDLNALRAYITGLAYAAGRR